MARLIPKKASSKCAVFRRVTAVDLVICAAAFLAIVFVVISTLPLKPLFVLAVAAIAITLVIRVDALPIYIYVLHFLRHFVLPRRFVRDASDELLLDRKESKQKAFGELFRDEELRQQELNRLLEDPEVSDEVKEKISEHRAIEEQREKEARISDDKMQCGSMEQLCAYTEIKDGLIGYANRYFGAVLELPELESEASQPMLDAICEILRDSAFGANIVKIDRPAFTHNELLPAYYVVLFDKDKKALCDRADRAVKLLGEAGISAWRLDSANTAVFLKYCNFSEFDVAQSDRIPEQDLALWSMPRAVKIKPNTVEVNQIVTHNFCAVVYPELVNDGWLASLFSVPSSKCVLKLRLMDRKKAIDELKSLDLSDEQTLLLTRLETKLEDVLKVSLYVTAYDRVVTEKNSKITAAVPQSLPKIVDFKKKIRQLFAKDGIVLNSMPFDQLYAFLGTQISAKNPCDTWLMPVTTLAASGAWTHGEVLELAESETDAFADVAAEETSENEKESTIFGTEFTVLEESMKDEETVDIFAEETADDFDEDAAEEASDIFSEEAAEETIDIFSEDTIDETADVFSEEAAEETIDIFSEDPIDETADVFSEEAAQETVDIFEDETTDIFSDLPDLFGESTDEQDTDAEDAEE